MALTSAQLKLNLELWQRGYFAGFQSVVEIGSQELRVSPQHFDELLKAAGVSEYPKEDFSLLRNWPRGPRPSARSFYKLIGLTKYSCVDLNGQHDAIPLDLNFPLENKALYGQYDLVTDYGSNEHVFNVAEAYRTMHRLCKPGGLLVIGQAVYNGNGYYRFDPSFFEGLAAANGYKILFSSYVIYLGRYGEEGFHIPLSIELLNVVDWSKVLVIGICYVFQKQNDVDFQTPYIGSFLTQDQGNLGYQCQFLPQPPSRTYVPIFETELARDMPGILLNQVSGKLLTRIILQKVWRKLWVR